MIMCKSERAFSGANSRVTPWEGSMVIMAGAWCVAPAAPAITGMAAMPAGRPPLMDAAGGPPAAPMDWEGMRPGGNW